LIEPVGGPDRLAQGKITGQDDVLPVKRDDQSTLDGPRPYPWDAGERRSDLVVGEAAQGI